MKLIKCKFYAFFLNINKILFKTIDKQYVKINYHDEQTIFEDNV